MRRLGTKVAFDFLVSGGRTRLSTLYFSFFPVNTAVVEPWRIISAGKNTRVSFTLFPQRKYPVHLRRRAMHGSDPEFYLYLVDKSQTAHRE